MPLHEQPHREMAEFISDLVTSSKILLVPRDCWKTSIGSMAFPLWMTLRAFYLDGNPGYRCLIDSSTTRLSAFVLGAIKSKIQHEESFKEIFGTLYDRKGDRQEGLSLKFRVNAAVGVKEPNFVPSGVNAAKTGLHFELMVLDDLVTKENARTVEQRQKVWDHYRMMQAILESNADGKDTMVLVTGTRYHDDDIYGRLIKQDKELVAENQPPIYSKLIRAAVTEDGDYYFPGEPGKPGGLSKAVLDKKKLTMGPLFWAQMMNDPNSEEAPFKAEQLRFRSVVNFPRQLNRMRLTIDPAVKEEEVAHGDFTAMVVAGWDEWHQLWVVDALLDNKLTPGKFIDTMMHLASKWDVDQVLIEDDGSMQAMEILWRQKFERQGWAKPVIRVPANKQRGKLNRWLELQPYAERAGIRIAEEIPAATKVELMDQWSRAPFASYDDFMDALAMQTLYLPVTFHEGAAKEYYKFGEHVVDPVDLATNAPRTNNSPYYGTLADRFPHLRALKNDDSEYEPAEDLYAAMEKFV